MAALRRRAARLRKTIVRPEGSPSGLVVTVALLPPVVAGLVLFRTQALLMLAVAAVAAIAAHVGVRLLHWPRPVAPGLAALVGVALVGPGASLAWVAVVAVLAAGLEVARARYVAGARLQAGLIAYAVVLLASRG